MNASMRVYAKIDLDAVESNFAAMRANIKEATKMIAVIKADGYGHGAVPIARVVEHYDYLWGFAVAMPQEARELREAGIRKPILILGYTFREDYEELIRNDVRPVVFTYEMAKELSDAAVKLGKDAWIHIGLDTGMTRIGFADTQESIREIQKIRKLPGVQIEGMFTHFARADETDKQHAYKQLDRYLRFRDALKDVGIEIPVCHCSNSAGIIELPEANLDIVRAGITVYGIYPSSEVKKDIVRLQPVMELKSRVSYVKEVPAGVQISYGGTFTTQRTTIVATIPVGYADGYPRSLSNRGWVLIHGQKAPILGRVCMDQFMVDVTDIPNVRVRDEVTLIGRDGEAFLSIDTLGDLSGRFSYEFACDINKRVPRLYLHQGTEFIY
ncbi:MAG: alanine racemase [Eubacteriales bacterium]|nr:alanine racemase [Eubacteriales bacterium]